MFYRSIWFDHYFLTTRYVDIRTVSRHVRVTRTSLLDQWTREWTIECSVVRYIANLFSPRCTHAFVVCVLMHSHACSSRYHRVCFWIACTDCTRTEVVNWLALTFLIRLHRQINPAEASCFYDCIMPSGCSGRCIESVQLQLAKPSRVPWLIDELPIAHRGPLVDSILSFIFLIEILILNRRVIWRNIIFNPLRLF